MNRRALTRLLGFGMSSAATWISRAQPAATGATPTLYYVDGYHGGVRGHMPPGSWRDILNAMRSLPNWKLSLDIEPASWDVLKREDPQAYAELSQYLSKQPVDARVEIVNGLFGQPFGWANGGESNVRQITRGLSIIRAHFPKAVVETYAVQEPCWASCLPQILLSLGFKTAVLKNPGTAWGGYASGIDAEMVNWVGPDGSSIPAVPRYACEELLRVWETESVTGSPEFARKAVAHGIAHPAGNCLQDLGWAAKPKVSGEHIRYVTWREYASAIASKPSKDWKFTMEDILVSLPWGEKTLQTAAQQVRSAENRLLVAEKAAALAWIEKSAPWPGREFEEAWDHVLWAQHHDSWITVTTRAGRRAWAFQVGSGTMSAEDAANSIVAAAATAIAAATPAAPAIPLKGQPVRVVNTLGTDRDDVAELTLATDRGTTGVRVLNANGEEVPSQVISLRRYGAGQLRGADTGDPAQSINTATVLFRPVVPALGYSTYTVEPEYGARKASETAATSARSDADGSVVLENQFLRIRLDPARGGVVKSLWDKTLSKEFIDPAAARSFNEYRGYFIKQEQWRSTADEIGRIAVLESGPIRARVRITTSVGGCPVQTTITLADGQRRIDFQARLMFEQDTWIGDPWDIEPGARRSERRRSSNDGQWKLQALFPAALRNGALYKNAAYDVCKSRNADTHYQRWDQIKHNIILHWVDLYDEQQDMGLAVFSDHTTGYTYAPDHPLALVLAWGWEGGFWWGKCPLRGTQQIGYSVMTHAGRWDKARVSEESSRLNEPPITQLMEGNPPAGPASRSRVQVSGKGIEVPTLLVEGRRLLVRLFNAEGDEGERTISFDAKMNRVELVELDGRVVRALDLSRGADGRSRIRLALPRFGVRTLRCELG